MTGFQPSTASACGALVVGLVAFGGPATAGATDAESEVREVDRLAIERNQAIQAFEARIDQSETEARYLESRWPEPRLEYMADLSAPWTPHFTTGHMVQVMQQIPRGGARDAQADPARAEADVDRWEQREAKADLLRDLRLDIIELVRLKAQLQLVEDEIGLLDDALGVLEAVAPLDEQGDHGAFYQLELAREAAVDQRDRLESMRRARRSEMASRLQVDEEQIEAMDFPVDLLETWLLELPELEELLELARAGDPRLGRFDAEAEVADAQIELVDERTRPWPSVMAGYSNMPPMFEMDGPRAQMIQLGISIPLPIFGSQYDLEASQHQQARQAIDQQRSQRAEDLRGDVRQLYWRWETDQRRLQRFERELIPLATDLAEEVLVGMEVGERTASDFLTALRQEIEQEGRLIDLRAEQLERIIELQRLTGGRLGTDQPWAYPEVYGGEQ